MKTIVQQKNMKQSETQHPTLEQVNDIATTAIVAALNNEKIIQVFNNRASDSIAINLLLNTSASRGISNADALVTPRLYNAEGDTLVIMSRHHYDVKYAITVLVRYTSFDEKEGLSFEYTLYQENLYDKSKTNFCTPDGDMRIELERQLADIFKPDMVGRAALWTVVTLPKRVAINVFPELYMEPAEHEHLEPEPNVIEDIPELLPERTKSPVDRNNPIRQNMSPPTQEKPVYGDYDHQRPPSEDYMRATLPTAQSDGLPEEDTLDSLFQPNL